MAAREALPAVQDAAPVAGAGQVLVDDVVEGGVGDVKVRPTS